MKRFVRFVRGTAVMAVLSLGCAHAPAAPRLKASRAARSDVGHSHARLDINTALTVYVQRGFGHGSGIVISPAGHVLTAAHVVGERGLREKDIVVEVDAHGVKSRRPATVVAVDLKRDLAVLKVPYAFNAVAIVSETERLDIGTQVYNVGYPYDFGRLLGEGYVTREEFGDSAGNAWSAFRIDGGHGTSGGGIYEAATGRLVSVMSFGATSRGQQHPLMGVIIYGGQPTREIRAFLDENGIPYMTDRGMRSRAAVKGTEAPAGPASSDGTPVGPRTPEPLKNIRVFPLL